MGRTDKDQRTEQKGTKHRTCVLVGGRLAVAYGTYGFNDARLTRHRAKPWADGHGEHTRMPERYPPAGT